jgi:hypothetical protein
MGLIILSCLLIAYRRELVNTERRKNQPVRSWSSKQNAIDLEREQHAYEAFQNQVAILDSFLDHRNCH